MPKTKDISAETADSRSLTSLVSVVIPTFNRAGLIEATLESVRQQTWRPLEVIVVDDGSSDDTRNVVSSWAERNQAAALSVAYVHQPNSGGNEARNNGIRHAHGEVLAFLDSDDRWHPQKLEKQIAVLDSDPRIGAVYCGLRHFDIESGKILSVPNRSYPTGCLLQQMLVRDVTAPTSTYVVRKDVFDNVGCFDTDLRARQDWDMWIRIAAKHHIGASPEPLVDFGEHAGPRTISNPHNELNAYRRILEKYSALRAECPFSVRQAAKAAYYRRLGRVHFHQRISFTKAVWYQLCALFAWPFDFDTYAALLGMLLPSSLRAFVRGVWNRCLGRTKLAIRSH